jgi:hypothetical protein
MTINEHHTSLTRASHEPHQRGAPKHNSTPIERIESLSPLRFRVLLGGDEFELEKPSRKKSAITKYADYY